MAGDDGDAFDRADAPGEDGVEEAPVAQGLGHKTISFFGGFSLIINNVTGPGMVDIPAVFVTAGWLPALLLTCLLSLTAGAATHLLCDAIRMLPGNSHYERRVELLSAVQELLPRYIYKLAFAAFLISFTMSNIGAIVESAKTVDKLLLEIAPGTCAIEWAPKPGARCRSRKDWKESCDKEDEECPTSPFGDDNWVISLGFIIVACITVPLGRYNLDDSIWVQQGSFLALLVIVLIWLFCFTEAGLEQPLPTVGNDQSIMFGTLLFNYLFVATIPSWLNEKKPSVSAYKSIWVSIGAGTLIFAALGIFASLAYDGFVSTDDDGQSQVDLLERVLAPRGKYAKNAVLAARIAAYAFPPVALLSGIPVLSICIRYNLLEQKVCSYRWAMFWGVLFPWIASLVLYYGDALANAIDWSALFSAVPLNLVMPAWLYLVASSHGGGERLLPSDADLGLEEEDPDALSSPLLRSGDDSQTLASADAGSGDAWAFGAGGGGRAAAPTLGYLPRPGGYTLRSAFADLRQGEWMESDLGRKRAAARVVIFVGIAMNLAAFSVKAVTGG